MSRGDGCPIGGGGTEMVTGIGTGVDKGVGVIGVFGVVDSFGVNGVNRGAGEFELNEDLPPDDRAEDGPAASIDFLGGCEVLRVSGCCKKLIMLWKNRKNIPTLQPSAERLVGMRSYSRQLETAEQKQLVV